MMMENVRLKSLRQVKRLTQADLASLVCDEVERDTGHRPSVDAQAIGRLERGEITWPARGTRQALKKLLGARSDADLGLSPKTASAARMPVVEFYPASAFQEVQPWELVDALTRSTISPASLDQIERATLEAAMRYPSTPPGDLLPLVMSLTARIRDALNTSSSLKTSRQCVWLAGILAGLAGNLYFDLGDDLRATNYFEVGRIAGDEADDDGLIAWILTVQSIGQFFGGQTGQAAQALEQALTLVQDDRNPRRRAWVAATLARAYAADGNEAAALQSLERAVSSLDQAPPPVGIDFFDHARLNGIVGTSHMHLGQADRAAQVLGDALNRRSPEDHKGRALLTFDLASCRILEGEIEEACAIAGQALDIATGSTVEPIISRARSLVADLRPWQSLGSVQDLADRVRSDREPPAMLEG